MGEQRSHDLRYTERSKIFMVVGDRLEFLGEVACFGHLDWRCSSAEGEQRYATKDEAAAALANRFSQPQQSTGETENDD